MKYLTALLVMLAFVWVGDAQADDHKKMWATKNKPILIEGSTSPRMSVVFSHNTHRNIGFYCKTCHHESSSDLPYSSCRDTCHTITGARERDPMSMFMAFHAKDTNRSCYGCHSMLAEKSPSDYPSFKGCRPCHTSENQAAETAAKSVK